MPRGRRHCGRIRLPHKAKRPTAATYGRESMAFRENGAASITASRPLIVQLFHWLSAKRRAILHNAMIAAGYTVIELDRDYWRLLVGSASEEVEACLGRNGHAWGIAGCGPEVLTSVGRGSGAGELPATGSTSGRKCRSRYKSPTIAEIERRESQYTDSRPVGTSVVDGHIIARPDGRAESPAAQALRLARIERARRQTGIVTAAMLRSRYNRVDQLPFGF